MVVEITIDRKNSPSFDFNRGIPLMGPGVNLTMNSASPIKSGTNDYGSWHMWSANVENTTVFEGRKPNEKKIENYTGEVIFFAKDAMHKEILALAGGEDKVVINIRKEAEETPKGLVKRYILSKVGGSQKPAVDGLTPSEEKLVNDANSLVKSGYALTENDFVMASKDKDLYGDISELRVRALFKFVGK